MIEDVDNGQLKKAQKFGILPSTLSMILKNRNRITESTLSGGRKRSRPAEFPHLENCLIEWIRQCKDQNVPVGGFILKEKAKSFAKSLGTNGFNASDGWVSNFKNRYAITFKKYAGRVRAWTTRFVLIGLITLVNF